MFEVSYRLVSKEGYGYLKVGTKIKDPIEHGDIGAMFHYCIKRNTGWNGIDTILIVD